MKKHLLSRITAMVLAAVMCFGGIPGTVFAAESDLSGITEAVSDSTSAESQTEAPPEELPAEDAGSIPSGPDSSASSEDTAPSESVPSDEDTSTPDADSSEENTESESDPEPGELEGENPESEEPESEEPKEEDAEEPTPRIGIGVVDDDYELGAELEMELLENEGDNYQYVYDVSDAYALVPVLTEVENPANGSSTKITLSEGAELAGPNGESGATWESGTTVYDEEQEFAARLTWVKATDDFTMTYSYGDSISKTISVSVTAKMRPMLFASAAEDEPRYAITAVEKVGGHWLITFMGEYYTFCLDYGLDGRPSNACYYTYSGTNSGVIADAMAAGCSSKLEIQLYVWEHGITSGDDGYVYLPSRSDWQRVVTYYPPDDTPEVPEVPEYGITGYKVDAEDGFIIDGSSHTLTVPAKVEISGGDNAGVYDLTVSYTDYAGWYTATEISAPQFGSDYIYYLNSGQSVGFDLQADGDSEFRIANTRQKVQIEIKKNDSEATRDQLEEDFDDGVYEDYKITTDLSAVYDVYAYEDIIMANGNVRYAKDSLVTTITTDRNGYGISEKLDLGKFYVKERIAPEGYFNPDITHDQPGFNEFCQIVDAKKDTSGVPCYTIGAEFSNRRQKTIIEIQKQDEEDPDKEGVDPATGLTTVFDVYVAEDIYNPDRSVRLIQEGTLVDTITTNSSGFGWSKDLEVGRYVVIERTAPYGYTLNPDNVIYESAYWSSSTTGQENNAGEAMTQDTERYHPNQTEDGDKIYTNRRQKVQIKLHKVDEDDVYINHETIYSGMTDPILTADEALKKGVDYLAQYYPKAEAERLAAKLLADYQADVAAQTAAGYARISERWADTFETTYTTEQANVFSEHLLTLFARACEYEEILVPRGQGDASLEGAVFAVTVKDDITFAKGRPRHTGVAPGDPMYGYAYRYTHTGGKESEKREVSDVGLLRADEAGKFQAVNSWTAPDGTTVTIYRSKERVPLYEDTIVAILRTDVNGYAETSDGGGDTPWLGSEDHKDYLLECGVYEVREVFLPEGYQNTGYAADVVETWDCSYTNQYVLVNVFEKNWFDSVMKGHVSLTKMQGDITSGEADSMGANGSDGVEDNEIIPAEGVFFAIFLNSKKDIGLDEYGNYRPGLQILNSNGHVASDGNSFTMLPDEYYVQKPLDEGHPLALPTGEYDANGYPMYCLVDANGQITKTSVNPDTGKPIDANAYNAYYKDLYMVLRTNAYGTASSRDEKTIAWTAVGGSLKNVSDQIHGAMPLPYGTYTVLELNPNEGREAVYSTVRIGYESWIDNSDGGYSGFLRRPELGLNNAQPPQIVQNGLWGVDHDLFGKNEAEDGTLNKPVTDKTVRQRIQVVKVDSESDPTLTDTQAVAQYEAALETWRLEIAHLKDTGKYNAAVAAGTLPKEPQLSDFTSKGVINAEHLSGIKTYTAAQLKEMGYEVSSEAKFLLWAWNNVKNNTYPGTSTTTTPSGADTHDNSKIGDTEYGYWVVQDVGGSFIGTPDTPWTTDKDGVIEFSYPLAYGDYSLVEVSAPYGYWLGDAISDKVQDIINWIADFLGINKGFNAGEAAELTKEEIEEYEEKYRQYLSDMKTWEQDMQKWYQNLASLPNTISDRDYNKIYDSRPEMPESPLRISHDAFDGGNSDIENILASEIYKKNGSLYGWLSDYQPTSNIVNFSIESTDKVYPLGKDTVESVDNDAGYTNTYYVYNKILCLFVANENQKGYVELTKTGLQLTGGEQKTVTYNGKEYTVTEPVWETLGLADSEFEIRAATDIVTPDGTVRHKAGDVIAKLKTNENGVAVSEPMYLGEYEIYETKASYGYILDETVYKFVLEYQGQNVRIFPEKQYYYNIRQNIELEIEKYLEIAGAGLGATDGMTYEDSELFTLPHAGASTSVKADNVWYGLFAREDIHDRNGNIAIKAGQLMEVMPISSGRGISTLDLPLAKYFVQELDNADPAYIIPDTQYDFSFLYTADNTQWVNVCEHSHSKDCGGLHGAEYCTHECSDDCMQEMTAQEAYEKGLLGTGKGETVIKIKANDGIAIYNLLKRGYISLYKYDQDFALGLPEDVLKSPQVGTAEIEQKGDTTVTTTHYEDGTTLVEERTPFPVGSHVVCTVTREDGDKETYEYYSLEGAVFGAYDSRGVLRATAVTDEFGHAVLGTNTGALRDGLPYGRWVLRELESPDGYRISDPDASWTVEISDDGKIVSTDITGSLLRIGNQIDKPIVRMFKYDTGGVSLAGAEFTIYKMANEDAYRAYQAEKLEYEQAVSAGDTQAVAPKEVKPDWQVYQGEDGDERFVYTTDSEGRFDSGYMEDGLYRILETKCPDGFTGKFDTTFEIKADCMSRPRILSLSAVNTPVQPETPDTPEPSKPFPQTGN